MGRADETHIGQLRRNVHDYMRSLTGEIVAAGGQVEQYVFRRVACGIFNHPVSILSRDYAHVIRSQFRQSAKNSDMYTTFDHHAFGKCNDHGKMFICSWQMCLLMKLCQLEVLADDVSKFCVQLQRAIGHLGCIEARFSAAWRRLRDFCQA